MCELCGKDWSSFNHMIEECEVTVEWRIDLPGQKYNRIKEILDENGNKNVIKFFGKLENEISKKALKQKLG